MAFSYGSVHIKLGQVRGPAVEHDCVDCDRSARDWSHIHDTDQSNIDNYEPRCRSCHMLYDGHTRGNKNGHSILCEEDVISIRRIHASGELRVREIAEHFGVARQTITNIITGKKWSWVK